MVVAEKKSSLLPLYMVGVTVVVMGENLLNYNSRKHSLSLQVVSGLYSILLQGSIVGSSFSTLNIHSSPCELGK